MKSKSLFFSFFIAVLLFQSACNKYYPVQNIEPAVLKIDSTLAWSNAIDVIVGPYKYRLEKEMGVALAQSEMEMPKAKPESLLGNFLADAILEELRMNFDETIDFCVLNYGGIRLPNLPKGAITKSMVYELLPFDNFLVAVEMDGNLIEEFFSHFAKKGGWPISKEVKFTINATDTSANRIFIHKEELEYDKKYKVLIPDYIANGGDSCEMLKTLEQQNSGLYLRDALISYLKRNETISSQIENRIIVK